LRPSPPLSLTTEHLAFLIDRHAEHGLFFTLELPNEGMVWKDIDAMLHTNLSAHGLVLSPPPPTVPIGPDGIEFHHAAWVLLKGGHRRMDGTSKFQQHPLMTGPLFTVSNLKNIGKATPNPFPRYSCGRGILLLGKWSVLPLFHFIWLRQILVL
jgi:hypothetical protein